jgi:hypothetical protein
VCTHACTHTHKHISKHTHNTNTRTHTHTHNTNTCTHTHTYAHALVREHTHRYAHTYTQKRTPTYAHTNTHTHTTVSAVTQSAGMGLHCMQAQYVRYQGTDLSREGCWTAADSPGRNAGRGPAADYVKLDILEAPAEWAMPARVER